jgi:hypothetical protein
MRAPHIAGEADDALGALSDASLFKHEDSRYVESPQGDGKIEIDG